MQVNDIQSEINKLEAEGQLILAEWQVGNTRYKISTRIKRNTKHGQRLGEINQRLASLRHELGC